jgi:NADPH:quinone reductase
MKAWVCKAYGPPSTLALEMWKPTKPGPNEVRIRVDHAAVNFPDLLSIAGTYPIKSSPPFVPGVEGAGEVIECGVEVSRLKIGDRVCWQDNVVKGSFAAEVTLPEAGIARIPASVPSDVAACVPTVFGTAHFALTHRAALKEGEVVVVHGASGGVGLAAVQLARLKGATVIATGSDDVKLAVVKTLGADHVINVRTESIRERVLALTDGRGADIYVDPVGGELFDQSLRAIAPYGRILVIGFTSGWFPMARANILLVKAASIIGANYGHFLATEREAARDRIETMLDWIADGRFTPHIHARFPFECCVEALEALAARQVVGKCVIEKERQRSIPPQKTS